MNGFQIKFRFPFTLHVINQGSAVTVSVVVLPATARKPVKYYLLPSVANKIDVGLIPFVINDVTNAAFPLKLFEYMAMGIPVVSTAVAENMKYEEVLIGKTHEEFIEKVEQAIILKENPEFTKNLIMLAKGNDWKARIKAILTSGN